MTIREKIQQYISRPDVKLLSQIPVSENEYKELLEYARSYVLRMYMQTIVPADIVLSVALVQIAIRTYYDGNYWEYFLEELEMDVSSSKRNYIGQVFAATLRKYRLFEIPHEQGAKYAYVENIKAHAFVPNNYLHGYFDFLFAFYDKNILRQLPDNIDEEFLEMSEFFASTLRASGDSFSLTNLNNKPAKSYKLLKATRTLFAECSPDVVSKEIYRHLQIIDDFYYDNILPDREDRFGEAFCLWQIRSTEINDSNKGTAKRRSGAFYHKPYFCIDRANGTADLVIPEQKIRNEDFTGEVYAIVTQGGQRHSFRLSLYRAFGVIVSEQLRVPVGNIFDDIEVIIKSNTEKKFEIPSRPYRIFDSDSVEMLKLRAGQNYLVTQKGTEVRGHKAVYKNTQMPTWDEYSFSDVDEKTVIYIDNAPISIMGTFADGPDFAYVSKEYKLFSDGREIQTAFRHPAISFRLAKETYAGSFLWCNHEKYRIDDVAASVIELPYDTNSYGVTILLDELLDEDAQKYRIFIDEPAKQRYEICKYVFIPDLRCMTDKLRYIFATEAMITLAGDYNIEPINAHLLQGTSNEYLVDLLSGHEQGEFTLELGDDEYTLIVPLRIFKHGFERIWQYDRPDYLWAADLKNDLYVSMPGAVEASVYIKTKYYEISAPGTSQGNGVFRFDISELAEWLRKNANPIHYISLKYKDNKERKLSLYKVLNRLYVNKAEVVFDQDDVFVDVQYEGKSELVLRFVEEGSGKTVAEKTVFNGRNEFAELSPTGLYTMHMLETLPDPFGFSTETRSIGNPRTRVGAINYTDISNCKINVLSVSRGGEALKLDYSYAVFSLEKQDEFTYTGILYEQKKVPMDAPKPKSIAVAKPVIIEGIADNGEFLIVSMQTEYEEDVYDPLYYDRKLKKLVRSDLVSVHDYSRFVPLYDDSADYQIRIRRIQ